jgi:flagellar motor switch/type III secretory pathway protein FliN
MFNRSILPPKTNALPYVLTLRDVPQSCADLESRLATLAPAGSAVVLAQDVAFTWSATVADPVTPCQIITVMSDDQAMRISVSRNLIPHLLGDAAASQMPATLSADTSALILEHLLTSFLDLLELAMKRPLHITSVSRGFFGQAALSSFRFRVTCANLEPDAMICVQTPDPDWMLFTLRNLAGTPTDTTPSILVDVQFLSNEFELMRGDLDGLMTGDYLVLDGDWDATRKIQMIAGHALTAQVFLGKSGFKLQHRLKRVELPITRKSTRRKNAMEPKDQDETFNHIAVTVSVEIESKTVTLSELRKYNAGSIIPLETAMPEKVRLLANNKPFATAELVKIGDKIAMQISELL